MSIGQEDAPRARILMTLAFTVIFVLEMIFIFKCGGDSQQTPVSPDPPEPPVTEMMQALPASPPLPIPDCDVVGMNQAGIKHEVNGRTLRLFVPMVPKSGLPYVNVWTPEVNSLFLGRCEANQWCSLLLPSYGVHRIRLAAETRADRVYQCDRIAFLVEAKPPVTTTTTTPRCKVKKKCETETVVMGRRWATAYIDACNFVGTATLTGTRVGSGGGEKVKTVDIDVGCECLEERLILRMDTRWNATFSSECAEK